MNPAQLLAYFERISEAPDAIARLRQFILELAVRGKLVDRDPKDEPASELLKLIQGEKGRRIKEGQIKKQVPLPKVGSDETWFDIPASWCWVRLGAITQVLMGQSPPGDTYNKTGEGVPLINGPVEFTEGPFGKTVINQYTTAATNICEEGDLLLCVRGSTTGRTNIAAFRACIGRGVAAIRPFFADQYVRLFIWRLRASIIAMGRGIAFPSVSRQQVEELPVPFPSLVKSRCTLPSTGTVRVTAKGYSTSKARRKSGVNRSSSSHSIPLYKPFSLSKVLCRLLGSRLAGRGMIGQMRNTSLYSRMLVSTYRRVVIACLPALSLSKNPMNRYPQTCSPPVRRRRSLTHSFRSMLCTGGRAGNETTRGDNSSERDATMRTMTENQVAKQREFPAFGDWDNGRICS